MCFFIPDTIDIDYIMLWAVGWLFQWLSVWYNHGILDPRKHIPYNFVFVLISGTANGLKWGPPWTKKCFNAKLLQLLAMRLYCVNPSFPKGEIACPHGAFRCNNIMYTFHLVQLIALPIKKWRFIKRNKGPIGVLVMFICKVVPQFVWELVLKLS